MPDDVNVEETMSSGTSVEEGEGESEEDTTADNVAENNPEDNKKLAELTMSEQLRQTFSLKLTIPRILQGLNTNQFFFIEVSDEFYETNYPEIIKAIAYKKFARFAGFEKGRFFVEKVEEKGGMDGWSTTITLNPIPPSLAIYSKMQKDAQKALVQAINHEIALSGSGGGGGNVNATGDDCTETLSISTTTFGDESFAQCAQTIIGNSSSNYAQAVAGLSCADAIKSIEYSYNKHMDNLDCPQKLAESWPKIHANCADHARLVKCICDIKGVPCAIFHGSSHYWNYVQINGKWESVDLCTPNNNYWDGHLRNTAGWNTRGLK